MFFKNKKDKAGTKESKKNINKSLRYRDKTRGDKEDQEGKTDCSILTECLEKNMEVFKEILVNDDTIIYRTFENKNGMKFCIIFADGMVDSNVINQSIIEPVMSNDIAKKGCIENLINHILLADNVRKSMDIQELTDALFCGDTIVLAEGASGGIIASSKGFRKRAIKEPDTEKTLRGPREGFTECLTENLSMIRRKLKTKDLKFKYRNIGVRSNTRVCICYIEGVANPKIIEELNRRLDTIDIDAILDSGYIQELIRDSPYTPFMTMHTTERPDAVAAKLLDGRIAVLVDGTPTAITLPAIFIEQFQVNEDYYLNFYFASLGRLLRITGFFITISLPAIYTALITFHQEMIPTPLLINISASREGVPFPTFVETIGMIIVFEVLREAGIRMPTFSGQALSIVGALVIGQAAVEAKFISAPIVIIIALTGITGLMLPKLSGAMIILRIVFIVLASFLGLYGYIFGMAGLFIHLMELRSFGVPYMYELMGIDPLEEIKDTYIRAPWWFIKYRQRLVSTNRTRNKSDRGSI